MERTFKNVVSLALVINVDASLANSKKSTTSDTKNDHM